VQIATGASALGRKVANRTGRRVSQLRQLRLVRPWGSDCRMWQRLDSSAMPCLGIAGIGAAQAVQGRGEVTPRHAPTPPTSGRRRRAATCTPDSTHSGTESTAAPSYAAHRRAPRGRDAVRGGPAISSARLRECRGRARKTAAAAAALANRSGRVKHEAKHKLKGAASLERARRASMRSMRRAGAEEAEERRCGTAGRARSRQREAREQHAALPRARRR
jgi:hypothetical protein